MELNISEALRCLGVHEDPKGAVHQQMGALARELQSSLAPRFVWRSFDLDSSSEFRIPNSKLAQSLLADCTRAAVLVCTLGAEFDLWMKRLQVRDMGKAVMLDALGSAYVEAICDEAEKAIRLRFPGMYLTDRFSPGYGDLPLHVQPLLMEYAGASRIGLTVTDSMLMNPQKSVTAIVGIADRPQPARIRGCAYCAMNKTCQYKKNGSTCHV